ncbi:MAG: hypothetical protein J5J00_10645 [Deltaproteobacteria bacterium]|nr:hypothetical protein [Deltaproteobacteria bacterium]
MNKKIGESLFGRISAMRRRIPSSHHAGLTIIEMIVILTLVAVLIPLGVYFIGGMSASDSPSNRMTRVSGIESSMKLLDSYQFITGEKYPATTIDGILQARVNKTYALLRVNMSPAEAGTIVGVLWECRLAGDAATACGSPVSEACSDPAPGACPTGAALDPLRSEVFEYVRNLSSLTNFPGAVTLMVEAQAPVAADGAPVVEEAFLGLPPRGGSDPTIAVGSPSPGPGSAECSDGVDNDGDGFTDFGPDPLVNDPNCANAMDPDESA